MSLLPSLPRSASPSPGSSRCSTPRPPVMPRLNSVPTDLQTSPPVYSEEKETIPLRRGRYSSDPAQFTDHPTFRVTSTDFKETSFSPPSPNDFNDRMISTFRDRSRSPASSLILDEGELRPQSSDHPLSSSWWGEEKHVLKPWRDPKKKAEQAEALQKTRIVSNNVISDWVSSSRAANEWVFLWNILIVALHLSLEHLLMAPVLESRTSHCICIGNRCRYRL
jgi:hypothetical protein